MKDQANIVIIGGGIAGCSIALHLAQMGRTDVILLDKGELTSGSTWHAAGMVTQFHTSPTLMRMRIYSVEHYRQLTAETGGAAGWHEVGSLRVAASKDHFKFLQRQISQAKALGMNVEMISPAQALKIFPPMSGDDLYGALHIPGDGHVNPSDITMEIARRAKALGVTIVTGARVTGIERGPRGDVTAVNTEQGRIKTEIVVNAAGMWGRQVGEMVGVNLPMTPLIHQHLATKPIPGGELPHNTPCLRDQYNLFYLREEVGGYLVGGFEVEPKAWAEGGVPWDFTQQLFPADWDLFEPIMEGAIRRVPILAKAEIMHIVNGPEAITPDSRPLLGPVPGVPGYFAACGLSHTGFGAGAAIGQIISEWIVNGEPPYDVSELNVRRFGPIYKDRSIATARAREAYKFYYVLRYPHDENETVRGLRLSPLHSRLEALGAAFGEKNGWERVNYFDPGQPSRRMGAEQGQWGWGRPPYFKQVGEEHKAARERAALFDMTSFGKIDVRGPGALALMQRLTDSEADKPVGSVIYTQFLNPRGGIESDLTLTRLADDHFRVVTGSNFVPGDLGWIQMHVGASVGAIHEYVGAIHEYVGAIHELPVQVREVTDDFATIGLWGPRARDVLQAATKDDVSNAALPYMTARTIHIAGAEVLAQRVTYVGELGWEMYTARDQAGPVWDALMSAGKPFGIVPAGYKCLDTLRLEKGYRYWSGDITPTENPYEAGLGFCVRLSKGDFIGREALVKIKAEGVQRKLCTITMNPDVVAYGGEAVYVDEKIVGRLRSGGYGFTVNKSIGYVYLPIEISKTGTPLEVECFGEMIRGEVAADVLYDPKGEKLKV